jgi:hypothetical protein
MRLGEDLGGSRGLYKLVVKCLVCALLVTLPAGGLAAANVDYADSRQAGLWPQHPVYGGPSFDAFVHAPHNPLHRGAPPFEWPVSSFSPA